jgi:hypothetical protein
VTEYETNDAGRAKETEVFDPSECRFLPLVELKDRYGRSPASSSWRSASSAVDWMVADGESAEPAKRLIGDTSEQSLLRFAVPLMA